LVERVAKHPPRGEMTVLIGSAPDVIAGAEAAPVAALSLSARVAQLERDEGLDRKAALKQAARERGLNKRDAYKRLLLER
jgi:16S rRNA (cytidine1402-2'-O)-methyltransferase